MTSSDPEHTNDLTQVELLWLKQRIENWIRFGRIADETIINSNRRVVSFSPGSIFAFVRWASNDYGTVASRIGHPARDHARRALFDRALRAPRRRNPLTACGLAQGRKGAAGHRRHRGARHRSGRRCA